MLVLPLINTLSTSSIYLNNILHVPAITKSLLNISKLLHNYAVLIEFHPTMCFVKDKNTETILLKGIVRGGLYQVEGLIAVYSVIVSSNVKPNAMFLPSKSVSSFKHHLV